MLWGIEPESLKGKMPKFLPDVPEVREDVADYLGECEAFDAYIGVILKRLEISGELENTLVVLSGDHGMPGVPAGKCNLYDHGVAVALAIRVPGGKGGRVIEDFVRLPDLANMQVKVTIHESRVDQIHAGLPARIVIQDKDYAGRVLSIANQPSPGSWYSAKVKEYATTVSIDGESTGLRPGMTAKVTILIDDLSDALSLPVSAVVEQKGTFYCWVKAPPGPERRPMKLGRTNDKLIEVVDGVKEGEEVFRNPRAIVVGHGEFAGGLVSAVGQICGMADKAAQGAMASGRSRLNL